MYLFFYLRKIIFQKQYLIIENVQCKKRRIKVKYCKNFGKYDQKVKFQQFKDGNYLQNNWKPLLKFLLKTALVN